METTEARGTTPLAAQDQHSTPILRAIRFLERRSTAEVRIHVVKRWLEKDPIDPALDFFEDFGMTKTRQRNAVLIYLNRSSRKFAIIADEGAHRSLGQRYWDELAENLSEDLRSTHFENALALAVFALGTTFAKKFPRI